MKNFFNEYGKIVLALFVVLTLIGVVNVVKEPIGENIGNFTSSLKDYAKTDLLKAGQYNTITLDNNQSIFFDNYHYDAYLKTDKKIIIEYKEGQTWDDFLSSSKNKVLDGKLTYYDDNVAEEEFKHVVDVKFNLVKDDSSNQIRLNLLIIPEELSDCSITYPNIYFGNLENVYVNDVIYSSKEYFFTH